MGLLDLPAPLFAWIDGQLLGFLPPIGRLIVWSAVAALGSMELYRVLSPQARIKAVEFQVRETQQRLGDHEGSFEDAWLLIRRMLGLAFGRILLVLPATLAASVPLLALIVWLDGAYGRAVPPPGEPVSVHVPGEFRGRWIAGTSRTPPHVEIVNGNGRTIADVAVAAPVPVIHKHRWWNFAIGNPAGYLPHDAPVERIEIDLPRQEFLSLGPEWLRGWEVGFFVALTLFALGFKVVRRID